MKIITPLWQADDGTNIGGNDPGPATPGIFDLPEDDDYQQDPVAPAPGKPVQTPEENAKYAAARRDAEEKARLAEEKARLAEEKLLNTAHSLGYDTLEEYESAVLEWKKQRDAEEKAQRIDTYGYDPQEIVEKLVDERLRNDPRMVEIEKQQQISRTSQAIEQLNGAFALGLKTVEDLDSIDNAETVAKLVRSGFDITEAYRMANYKTIAQKEAAALAKKGSESGRAELGGIIGTPDSSSVTVPQDVAEPLKRIGWSDDKIAMHYKKLVKNTK